VPPRAGHRGQPLTDAATVLGGVGPALLERRVRAGPGRVAGLRIVIEVDPPAAA
jgi:hypothetical protein